MPVNDAKLQAGRVCLWVKDNPKAFKTFMSIGHSYVDAGKPRLTRSRAYSIAEDMGVRINDDDGDISEAGITRNHNFWPCLTRYMVMLRPRLARTLHFRPSKFDDIELSPIWHENVNAGTFFLAKNRKEAQRMVELDDVAAR